MSTPQIIGTSHSIVQRDGQTYIAVDGMTPDQIITWMHEHHRTEAFAAIRRAAEVAREYDSIADTAPYNASGRAALYNRARAVREAIRAAIGSEKS